MNEPRTWRPYIAGALAGLLAVGSVWISTELLGKPKYLGASTTFVRAAGLIEEAASPKHVEANAYFQGKKVRIDWQFMLVVGIAIGALGASVIGGGFRFENAPPIWAEQLGRRIGRRAALAFIGGAIAMFGARLAGGCPSGHGLSGLMQLSVSGYLALASFFVFGAIAANLIYSRKEA